MSGALHLLAMVLLLVGRHWLGALLPLSDGTDPAIAKTTTRLRWVARPGGKRANRTAGVDDA